MSEIQQMTKQEHTDFGVIRKNRKLDVQAVKLIAGLHSKYFKHQYYEPCTCSKSTWQQWIAQLNSIWDNGYKEGT